MVLSYTDMTKKIHFTADAANHAGKQITFLSGSLGKTEEDYAANEKKILAIVSLNLYPYVP